MFCPFLSKSQKSFDTAPKYAVFETQKRNNEPFIFLI